MFCAQITLWQYFKNVTQGGCLRLSTTIQDSTKPNLFLAWAQVPQRVKTSCLKILNNRSAIHLKHDTVFNFKIIHSYLDIVENTPKKVHCLT